MVAELGLDIGSDATDMMAAKSSSLASESCEMVQIPAKEDSLDDYCMLPELFAGLDFVLRLLAARGVAAYHGRVRTDVEAVTHRALSDDRLIRILGLAGPGMLDVRWVGKGKTAKLEIFQRAKDGKERHPTMDEQRQRKEDFKAAFDVAVKASTIAQRDLPPCPSAGDVEYHKPSATGMLVLPEPPAATRTSIEGASAHSRKAALLERVRARESRGNSAEAKEYAELRHRILVCDNALTVHSVLQSLFARAEGKFSAATESEVIKALCSMSFGMQCVKTMDKPVAQEAVQMLVSKADGWFSVENGVHVPDLKCFRRLPKGTASIALAAIHAERQHLEEQLRGLCKLAQRHQQPQEMPSIDVVDSSNLPAAMVDIPQPLVAMRKRIRRKTGL